MDLIHLPVRTSVPSLGSHRFVLRSGSRTEEVAILIDDVLYYTLPCIAELVFPDPAKWKKSWETVYRSLMPHRHNIIQDEDRVRSVSELPATRPPHGNPGAWTTEVINEIARLCGQAARAARCSARRLREVLAVHPEDQSDLLPVSAHQEGSRNNQYGILFSFEPRRKLPDNLRSQSISPFFWARNTDIYSAIGILKALEMADATTSQSRVHQLERSVDSSNGFLLQREPCFS